MMKLLRMTEDMNEINKSEMTQTQVARVKVLNMRMRILKDVIKRTGEIEAIDERLDRMESEMTRVEDGVRTGHCFDTDDDDCSSVGSTGDEEEEESSCADSNGTSTVDLLEVVSDDDCESSCCPPGTPK
jgi:hypothetical protein